MGHRLGRLLLDRPSPLFAPLGDPPDPSPNSGTTTAIKLSRGRHRPVHPTVTRSCSPHGSRTPRPCGGNTQPSAEIILSIDGLQPEKGHETLYVVRELTRKRVWFAEPLLSATADEVRRLIAKAREWAEALGKPVALWLSDKQDAFVTGIAAEFPDVPHRYCDNHFLRDLAKPVLEADSHAKVQMRKKVRGLRTIEQAVLQRPKAETKDDLTPEAAASHRHGDRGGGPASAAVDPAGAVVLDYCAAVRGILNDDQGGPLHPPGLRMAEALSEVRESIQRNLDEKKGVRRGATRPLGRMHHRRAWTKSRSSKRRSEATSR